MVDKHPNESYDNAIIYLNVYEIHSKAKELVQSVSQNISIVHKSLLAEQIKQSITIFDFRYCQTVGKGG